MYGSETATLIRQQPRNLPALLTMYEGNFLRLMRVIPELDRLDGTVVSRVAGALDLYLSVEERFRYTTTIFLTYHFETEHGLVAEPNARIRVYHDARAVEVLSHCRRRLSHIRGSWRRRHVQELDRRWEPNRFLQKWLGFCRRQGHMFLHCTATPVSSHLPSDRGGSI
ncbi:MAG: DUF1249 domain-containing protein [Gammaproteobacteria bacterium]|nr:MAG: DUF1249 domain-containing protein [Gammaproteobacteria bacterium]